MKQHITPEQLNELSDKAKEKIRGWWEPQIFDVFLHYDKNKEHQVDATTAMYLQSYGKEKSDAYIKHTPLLSIGQMIEFLVENNHTYFEAMTKDDAINLCDDLWKDVKEVLEQK